MRAQTKKTSNKKRNKIIQNQRTNEILNGDFYKICKEFLMKNFDENFYSLSSDQSFALAVTSREEGNNVVTRQAILNLLNHIDDNQSTFINKFIRHKNDLYFTEKLNFLLNLDFSNSVHPFFIIIKGFIESTSTYGSYINCFMGKSSKYTNTLPKLDVEILSSEVLNNFYEIIHRFLYDKNSMKLEELTYFIYKIVKNSASQSLLFFMNYFSTDSLKKINFAHQFLNAKNFTATNYCSSLAYNTSIAAINLANFVEADFWLKKISDINHYEIIQKRIINKKEEIKELSNHPFNPQNSFLLKIQDISTTDLIFLCIYLDSCGDDWGLKPLKNYSKYIFPYYMTTLEVYKILALKKIITLLPSSFLSYTSKELNDLKIILEQEKFHINIKNIQDSKTSAFNSLYEIILNRIDLVESCFDIWKKIALDYFFCALDYNLTNLRKCWAENFQLNEKTILNLSKANLSAKTLSYIAKNSTNYAAGQHAKKETYGNNHTCNLLLSSINRHLEWIEKGTFINNSCKRNRQPMLSSEKILEIFAKISPEDIYNLQPDIDILYQNITN